MDDEKDSDVPIIWADGETDVIRVKGVVEHLFPLSIGGPVLAGQDYVVGERGPETFYPVYRRFRLLGRLHQTIRRSIRRFP